MPSEPPVPGTKPQPLSPQNAALRGASLAFNKKPAPKPGVKPKPEINGALAAAAKAGNGRQVALRTGDTDVDDQRLAYQNTASSVRSYTSGGANGVQRVYPNQYSSPNSGNGNGNGLLYPNYTGGDKARSGNASLIAATLAASRSPSVSPNPTGQRERNLSTVELRRQSSFERKGRRSESAVGDGVERESIPPTKGLIGLFERNEGVAGTEKESVARRAGEGSVQGSIGKSVASPVSIRAQSPTPSFVERPKPEIKAIKPSLAQNQRLPPRPEPQEPPPPRKKPALPPSKPIPIPPSTRRPPILHQKPVDDASSDESFVSASDTTSIYKPSFRATLTEQKRRPRPSTNNSLSSAQTIDSMANAIVASSLAASRSASPSKSSLPSQNSVYPPPPPPRRHHLFHAAKADSRTPSPVKQGMKTTMRKQKSKEEIDEGEKRRGRKNLMKKHPNKHHEGDRKRWRDSITERERKRYEAVWASNKGLLLLSTPPPSSSRGNGDDDDETPSTGPAAGVCNLVVKDIWSRSRLDDDVLEEVYELVDRKQVGWLAREEFVVGLWLIDQRLKGRKLPIRVSDSVWRSVGILGGIKVRRMK